MTTFRAAEGTRGLLVGALIVMATTGCDNVEWGGASLSLQPPPGSGEEDPTASASDAPAPPSLPNGELLFVVSSSGDRRTATAIAFVNEGGTARVPPVDNPRLGPLLANRLAGIGELTLFANGTRAGTALVSGAAEEAGACVGLPRLDVGIELRERANEWPTLLAMPRSNEPWEHGDLAPPAQVREVRAASLSMAGNMINGEGAVWPPSVIGIRRDIQLFHGPDGLGVAASFLYRDRLDASPSPAGSYSIFVMGEERPDSVHQTYGDFHRSGTDGKQAPRYLASLDWDRDGESEVVLEVFAEGQRSYRLLERDGAQYVDALDVVCGGPS
ncbi:MAG: hypothetical protein HKN73_16370 [Gemmatimonadetes bacterium]|nr:hypothetical protein [Gemmatimonadota bacterium]